ncbi:sphingomyelin phosphodiesterase 3 isoform X2 [Engystomops pustulosus]|uniref:sphingomyelin phosphodiesterase 3 isoform X2 n=1 Tax=Engystomops pustulosus TaxID=76066 RepID=UPI003AFA1DD2
MVLHTSPFPSSFLSFIHSLSWALIFPCFWLGDRLLASFLPTTYEKRQRSDDPCYFQALCIIITTPIYLALLVSSLPFAFIGFLVWSPLQAVRRPYIYSRLEDKARISGAKLLSEWKATSSPKSFCFGSANVCLLPDSLARFTNLFNTQARAKEIGRRIRNGASRPQIKIYIDSPTNTSISAASFSSLISPQGTDVTHRAVNMGMKRTTSMEYKVEHSGENSNEEGKDEKNSGDMEQGEDACIIRISGEDSCHISDTEPDTISGHINVACLAETEPDFQKNETSNHKHREGDGGSLDSCSTSRESLIKGRVADGATDQSSMNNRLLYKASIIKKAAARKKKQTDDILDHDISAFFPANLDFLCLQEVFDKRAAEKLKEQLHYYFEYILYDVGVYSCHGCCVFKFLNSGLMFASRYPILDATYHCYPNGRGIDALAAKGALFVKVQVGTTPQDQRIVGYVSCTHLHALSGDAMIRCEQLDLLLQWMSEFRKFTSSSSAANPEELVAFDVLCGDLNFDNCSSGTLLDPEGLYDEEVCTPDNLQKVLENEDGRKEYLVYPTSKNHCPNHKGRKVPLKGNGRRIDYMLYSEERLNMEWKEEIEEYSFITQLAGLTDHVPVAMRLTISTGEEES